MKYFILTLTFIFVFSFAHSQATQKYNALNFNPAIDSIAEGLVALAMNNPSIRSAENFALYNQFSYKVSKTLWLNNITAVGNLNEFSLKQNSSSNQLQYAQYPRYNFGVIIPLGIFVNNPKQSRADYYRFQAAVNQIDVEKRSIRREVLINYQDFLMNIKLRDLQQQVLHDWEVIYAKNEEKFTKGEVSLESFTNTSKMYNDELDRQVGLSSALKTAEAKLEALIGMNVYDAIQQIRSRNDTK